MDKPQSHIVYGQKKSYGNIFLNFFFLTAGTCPYKLNSLWLQQLGAMYVCASELVLAANAAITWGKLTYGMGWVWELFLKSGRLEYRSQSRESGRTHSQEHSCLDGHCHVSLIKVFSQELQCLFTWIFKNTKIIVMGILLHWYLVPITFSVWSLEAVDTPFWLCGGLKGTVISTSLYVPVSIHPSLPTLHTPLLSGQDLFNFSSFDAHLT